MRNDLVSLVHAAQWFVTVSYTHLAKDYIPRTVRSILAQSVTDFELLLVEDGSPNGCGEDVYKRQAQPVVCHPG